MQPPTDLPPLWPPQVRALSMATEAYRQGHRSICITIPTGGGKTRLMGEIAARAAGKGKRVGIFSNKKILTGQMKRLLERAGVSHGVLAAGHEGDRLMDVQVVSVQTLNARGIKSKKVPIPEFDLVIFDEAHSNAVDGVAYELLSYYKAHDALAFLLTATPVGMKRVATTLVQPTNNTELRQCGALVPCTVFAPDEPDMKGVKKTKVGEYVHEGMVKAVMETLVFANVFDHWKKLNPFQLATLVWAPGVPESRWFAQQFQAAGVNAAHLDGETSDGERERIFRESEAGTLPVICSYGVLREGADLPWIRHGILTQPCALLRTFLQIVGRLLRAYPGKTECILQDHAGAWHRPGNWDPNADRVWSLDDTDKSVSKPAPPKEGDPPPPKEPLRCPQCGNVRLAGPACMSCGHQHIRSVRMVRMTDGSLKRVVGNANKVKAKQSNDPQRVWSACLYAAAARGRTVGQATADYKHRTGNFPNGVFPPPPGNAVDYKRKAVDVYPHLNKRKGAPA